MKLSNLLQLRVKNKHWSRKEHINSIKLSQINRAKQNGKRLISNDNTCSSSINNSSNCNPFKSVKCWEKKKWNKKKETKQMGMTSRILPLSFDNLIKRWFSLNKAFFKLNFTLLPWHNNSYTMPFYCQSLTPRLRRLTTEHYRSKQAHWLS